jgi:nascent polypeptide-associated complex subunit alpha
MVTARDAGGDPDSDADELPALMPVAPHVDDATTESEDGMPGKDIDLVVQQSGSSRAAAVRALRRNEGDIVSAIMELTD